MSPSPQLTALLDRAGLGPFVPDGLARLPGRNENWLGTTVSGTTVFAKRLIGPPGEAAARMRREVAYHRNARGGPRCLAWDEESRALVLTAVPLAKTGLRLAEDGEFDRTLAYEVGTTLRSLHGSTGWPAELDDTLPAMPSAELLRGLPRAVFDECCAAELEAWRLLQRDDALIAAVGGLLARERDVVRVPSHGDLRLDQILVGTGGVYLTDWEEFRYADPARDVGRFAGEWLWQAVSGLPAAAASTTEAVVEHGAARIDRTRPIVAAFWWAYQGTDADEALAVRATAFAGWHLVERMIAGAAGATRLSAVAKAAAGIGRSLLCGPEAFVTTVGLG
ncbi:class V lanthionine synthetase subunit LxmK [Amycolatopsis sp. NPDC059027]|uniref:class V lanthionine synthetase subunit LxmK n=1 Tax=Amycolatopsis sp. NPDC059027 TaxID=3346709 RepID=UPI00366BD62F